MNVSARFHGILADWVGTPTASFELSADATYTDLMKEIGRRYRKNMPGQLWDKEKNTFKKQVQAFGHGRILNDLAVQLLEGEQVTFLLMMAGG